MPAPRHPWRVSQRLLATYAHIVRIGRVVSILAVAGGIGLFAACSSSSTATHTAAIKHVTNGHITVGAYDVYFDVRTIDTSPGPLTVTLVNHGTTYHTFTVNGTTLNLRADPGKRTTGTVTLRRGNYTFLCTFPGHAAAGMRGTIHVS